MNARAFATKVMIVTKCTVIEAGDSRFPGRVNTRALDEKRKSAHTANVTVHDFCVKMT